MAAMRTPCTHARPLEPRRARCLAVLAVLALGACGGEPPAGAAAADANSAAQPPEVPEVLATMEPVAWLAARIAGEHARVECPLPADADPATWVPDRTTLARFAAADLVVAHGAGFERWLAAASLAPSRLVLAADGLASPLIEYEAVLHRHGPEGEHAHAGVDGHAWLDPENAIEEARAIEAALARRFPARAAAFAAGRERVEAELGALAGELGALAPALREARIVCSHPAYNYLIRRYGWPAVNVALDPAGALSEEARAELERALAGRAGGAPAIVLWESAPDPELALALERELGLSSAVFSPGEARGALAGGDYLSLQRANVARLAAALGR